jgi:putative two-component system response regulator
VHTLLDRVPEPKSRLLIVDDNRLLCLSLARLLGRQGYPCDTAADSEEAEALLSQGSYSLVLADMNLPGQSGLWLTEHVARAHPDTAVVMVTGVDDTEIARQALELGAYGYVIKPFEPNEIIINVANALRRRQLELENRAHRNHLESMVAERTMSLERALKQLADADVALRRAHEEAIQRLAHAAEFHDPATGAHLRRISRVSEILAEAMGLPARHCELIRLASPMHDIGKIAVADTILRKPGRLEPEEMVEMQRHPHIGFAMLSDSESDLLRLAADIALTHHEKWDGSGYPNRLAGDAIPLEGRIVGLADVFDALTSERPYKRAFDFEEAVDILQRERGHHFDPEVVDVFIDLTEKLEPLTETHRV